MSPQQQLRQRDTDEAELRTTSLSPRARSASTEVRDFTSFLKFSNSAAWITFNNGAGDSHKYKFTFHSSGKVDIHAEDVTGGIRLFRYNEDRSATISDEQQLSRRLNPILRQFMELLAKNTPSVTEAEALKVLTVAYLKAGHRANAQAMRPNERLIFDTNDDLNTKEEQRSLYSSAQLEASRLQAANCLLNTLALTLGTYTVNLRELPEFSRGNAQDIYHKLRMRATQEGNDLGNGAYALPIKHEGKLIGTFFCHMSQINDAPDRYKDVVYQAPFGSITFMRRYDRPHTTHVGFVEEPGRSGGFLNYGAQGARVAHTINESTLKDQIEEHTFNNHRTVGIDKNWEVSGIFVPAPGIVTMPSDDAAFEKRTVDIALVTPDGSHLTDVVSIGRLAQFLSKHSDFFKGVAEDHIKKALIDMNPERFEGNSLYNMKSRPGIPLRMPDHWLQGLDIKHLTTNREGKRSGYLYLPR